MARQPTRTQNRARSIIAKHYMWQGMERPEHCSKCGSDWNIQAHHDDYAKPRDVRWLCCSCHRVWHLENGPGANRDATVFIEYETAPADLKICHMCAKLGATSFPILHRGGETYHAPRPWEPWNTRCGFKINERYFVPETLWVEDPVPAI